jgi:hypothetical protein
MTVYLLTNEGNDIDGVSYRAYSLSVVDGKLEKNQVNLNGAVGWDRLDFFRDALKKAGALPYTEGSILNGFFPERGSKKRLCKIADDDFTALIK